MTLSKDEKTQLIGEYHRHDSDTGSPEVQVAILTRRIQQLTEHLKEHKHDESCRHGLDGEGQRYADDLTDRLGIRRK